MTIIRPPEFTPTYSTSWKEDFKNALRGHEDLENFFEESFPQTGYPLFIPLPFAQKIKEAGLDSPLGRQFLPAKEELIQDGLIDPIADFKHSKGHGIIHRYSNRILFTPTEVCPIQCRYCFRKNELHQNLDIFKSNLLGLKAYLKEHPEVEEVILTGGDPLVLSNSKVYDLLDALSQMKTVKMIRFHTRTPIILPNRINSGLVEVLNHFNKRFMAISFVIHTNHLSEWSREFLYGLDRLRKTQTHLLSQSVILKGVNDNKEDLKVLFNSLYTRGVRPYYLHHPDPVRGGTHFMISKEEGKELYLAVKKEVSGVVLPHYVYEQDEGAGKMLVLSN